MDGRSSRRVVALAGGVGGAKMAYGLYQLLPPGELTVIVNTGDDLDLYGLRVCPDLDTVMYTLAGVASRVQGWGVENDSSACLDMLGRYGEQTWFRVGDRDLATHLLRSQLLARGASLTECTRELTARLGIRAEILPMCDEPVRTLVRTEAGELEFQEYFVKRRAVDTVLELEYRGAVDAWPTDAILQSLSRAEMIVFCPSNPLLSIEPILRVSAMRKMIERCTCPKVAISPIVGGRALRGPADRLMVDRGHEPTALGVARYFGGLLDGFVLDQEDAALDSDIRALGLRTLVTETIMTTEYDKIRLARRVVEFGETFSRGSS